MRAMGNIDPTLSMQSFIPIFHFHLSVRWILNYLNYLNCYMQRRRTYSPILHTFIMLHKDVMAMFATNLVEIVYVIP